MKTVTFGKQITNNKTTRYALIIMKLNQPNGDSIDDIITFVYSNSLKELCNTKTQLREVSLNKPFYLDMQIYDYKNMSYVRI